jgi:hypothetical protein
MSTAFYPKNSQVMERSLEVETLVIPFTITSNATPANKVLGTDEASVLFLQTQGITQVTTTSGALDPGESAPPFDLSAADASGAFNLLVNVAPGSPSGAQPPNGDQPTKIMYARIIDRITGASYATYMNSTNPAIDTNGTKMLLNCASGVNLASTSINACLIVAYTVQE